MIIYHPLTDVYHSINRGLILFNHFSNMEMDRYSIYDYFLLFPQDLRKVSLPNEFRGFKKIKFQNKYNLVKNSKNTFKRLKEIQNITVSSLIMYGAIEADDFNEKGILTVKNKINFDQTPSEMDKKVIELIDKYFNNITLRELKERTKLTEYRYEHS
ncbi:ABC-three component system middle component 5 [uncultured Aquimarina sp.]|uniref:ABC-three component system middle component 5 n=1 Tax=uncultured Aquimarina sp. TaxID=575652 RepID=UPI0026198D37|nr:ABC-three component system middle component 5 [uncultured Aquimarina sp.]